MLRRAFKLGAGTTIGGIGLVGLAGLAGLAGSAYADTDTLISVFRIPTKTMPGVYLWGNNKHRLISAEEVDAVRVPNPVPYFDNKRLKDLAVSGNGEAAVAVLENGDCVQWTSPDPKSARRILRSVASVKAVGDRNIVALLKSGKIYSWDLESNKLQQVKLPKLGWWEKIVTIETGSVHLAALTSKGNVLTGLVLPVERHNGQLGLASFPSFDPAPKPLELRQVKQIDEPVSQIACGNLHTLFLTNRNKLLGCGNNTFGQLMVPYSYRTVDLSIPTPIPSANIALPDTLRGEPIRKIYSGGDISYLGAGPYSYASGNGQSGQLGSGSFAHCQVSPVSITPLNDLREFDDKLGVQVPILPVSMSVSPTHSFAKLSNGDWVVWGSGDRGQLGTGKLARLPKPTFLRTLPLTEFIGPEDVFVAGNNVSACYKAAN